jgi:hypothetical protein
MAGALDGCVDFLGDLGRYRLLRFPIMRDTLAH